jgi:hypothetical protein
MAITITTARNSGGSSNSSTTTTTKTDVNETTMAAVAVLGIAGAKEMVEVTTTGSGGSGNDVPARYLGQADLGQLGRGGGHGVQVAAFEVEFTGAVVAPVAAVLHLGRSCRGVGTARGWGAFAVVDGGAAGVGGWTD